MKFQKYHCLGNDYLILDPQSTELTNKDIQPELVRRICDRNFGLGADGILVGDIKNNNGLFSLIIFNSDGSTAEKSGNGLRIFARSLWDRKIIDNKAFKIKTLGGTVEAQVSSFDNNVNIEMGEVSFLSNKIPMTGELREVINETLEINDEKLKICAANIGNPHCIVLDRNISAAETRRLGPLIEKHSKFPNKTNVQFLEVLNRNKIRIEIWERGSGYTLASGSSSCAAASIAHKLGWCDKEIVVLMPGGEIHIHIRKKYNVSMKGPVTRIGEMELDPECLENNFPK